MMKPLTVQDFHDALRTMEAAQHESYKPKPFTIFCHPQEAPYWQSVIDKYLS